MNEILTIHNSCIKFRSWILFENLNFSIRHGEHWALVGPAGAGKTALLKTIAGDFFVADGKIEHHYYQRYRAEHQISDPLFSPRHLIGYLDVRHDFTNLSHTRDFFYQQRFNATYAEEAPTVEEYLTEQFQKAMVQSPWNLERVIGEFDLEPLLRKRLIMLSNGETKRLCLAAALLKNPRLLLLDNPLIGLDRVSRRKFDELFKKMAQSGITLVMVTSPRHIPKVVTHVLVMKNSHEMLEYSADQFKPEMVPVNHNPISLPDEKELRTLLNGEQKKNFRVLVHMNKVKVRYGAVEVLNGIDWTIRPGERWALSGPNGSGKSTLLSLIYGDHPQAYANDIVLFDRRRGSGESIWEIKREIGYMSPELFQYFPGNFTCRQVIESGFFDTIGLYQKVAYDQQEKAGRWMKVMGLEEDSDMLFTDLSTTRQRLCLLTRALVKNPKLLILDEPCQGFDEGQQQGFRNLIDAIAQISSLSIIYVTHYREELPKCIEYELKLT
ncbi:ATP-binding cassette domain-containing protein [Thermophagus xiamenensis]|uniref:Molybdate transport system ATP-binding protein n=1 Tax=Thermophagus xiamenensis TaxID=385682 RepID=A0A1I2DWJ0_9BACT|nr:ATP-binding cassette domain-containing protein [Thermophagus xiamenensis]SFE84699.1 molybdate transport system ATP-binding protein [Thermophagus xiamenensis]